MGSFFSCPFDVLKQISESNLKSKEKQHLLFQHRKREIESTEELLEKRKKYLNEEIQKETNKAKTFVKNSNRKEAIHCLAKRKRYAQSVTLVDSYLTILFRTKLTLDDTRIDIDVISVIKSATSQLRSMIEKQKGAVNVMSDLASLIEESDQLSSEISNTSNFDTSLMDYDFDEELRVLEQSMDDVVENSTDTKTSSNIQEDILYYENSRKEQEGVSMIKRNKKHTRNQEMIAV